jgi:hypothetical protein
MTKPRSSLTLRSRIAAVLLCLPLALPLTGCGTLIFPERQGQGSGKLDPNILILDAFGLLFFIVPGLVAFAVDFATGAIYLPSGVERGEGPFIQDGHVVEDLEVRGQS